MSMNAHNIRVEDNLWTRAGKRAAEVESVREALAILEWDTIYSQGKVSPGIER